MEKAASPKTYISCSWLRSWISKPENQGISAQYSKPVSLQLCKIHVLPANLQLGPLLKHLCIILLQDWWKYNPQIISSKTTQYLLGRDEEIYSNPSVLLATCTKCFSQEIILQVHIWPGKLHFNSNFCNFFTCHLDKNLTCRLPYNNSIC